MFHLENQFGNVHKMVQSEAKKDEMLKDGWKLVEEGGVEPEQKPKSGKKAKKTEE